MVGAGVFTTSGFSLADVGNRQHVMLAWGIGGLVAICGAISYGQLARRITESGGEYLFLSRLVHPVVGFIAGWVSLLAGFTGAIAFAAVAFESYAVPESMRPDWYVTGTASILSIVVCGTLHSLVLRSGLITQNIVVAAKLLLLGAFIVFGFAVFPDRWEGLAAVEQTTEFSVYAIASTLVWISLSYSGFNAAVYVTGEVKNPTVNVPRALLLGTVIVTVVYLVLNYIFLFAPLPGQVAGAPDVAAVAARSLGGGVITTIVRIIVSVALFSSVSSMVIAGPRVYAKMAEDGVFPNIFTAATRNRLDVPTTAIWLQVALAVIVASFSNLQSLLDYLGFTLSVTAALTVACVFWSRVEGQSRSRSVWFSVVAALYIVVTIILATLSAINRPQQLIGFAVTVLSGLVLFFVFRRRS